MDRWLDQAGASTYNTSTYAGPLHRAEVCRKQAVM